MWNTLLQMRENARDEARWLPSALPLWELHLCGSYKCLKPWLERQKNTKLGPQDTIKKVLKLRCLKFPRIIHLNLICMSYDQKKGWRSNWNLTPNHKSLESRGQMRSYWSLLYTIEKTFSKSYKILSLHFKKKIDLKNIWTWKVLG